MSKTFVYPYYNVPALRLHRLCIDAYKKIRALRSIRISEVIDGVYVHSNHATYCRIHGIVTNDAVDDESVIAIAGACFPHGGRGVVFWHNGKRYFKVKQRIIR